MRNLTRRFFLLIIMVLSVTQACLFSSQDNQQPIETEASLALPSETTAEIMAPPTQVEEEEEENIKPDPGEGTVLLWGNDGRASTNEGEGAYQTAQALGEPDTLLCGDFVTVWQPAVTETTAWIEVDYFPFILPEEIVVSQSYNPGQINRVEVITLDEEILTVFDADQTELADLKDYCPVSRNFSAPEVDVLIQSVRINLERNPDEPWTQIDALGVNGWVAEILPGMTPTQEGSENELDDSATFSNKNRINALLFEGERLWTGSNGGVVAWDLSSFDDGGYVHASMDAAYALAYCNWDIPLVVAGGEHGISTLMPPYNEYGPFFEPLDHPGDEQFGRVQALACDQDRQQIWVGYNGFVSCYDAVCQTWMDYRWRDGLPSDAVRKITVIDDDVWVATGSGVAVFYGGEDLEVFTTENSGLPCQFVHGIVSDESGILWMASSCGLVAFDGNQWEVLHSEDIEGGLLVDVLMDIALANDGGIWLGDTFGTLCEFDPFDRKCVQTLMPPVDYFSLDQLQVDPKGRIALGSLVSGLLLYQEDEWLPLETSDQILSNAIRSIAVTPDRRMWLAEDVALQNFLVDSPSVPWETVSLPNDAQAHCFLVTNDGLWIGHTRGARFIPYLEQSAIFDLPVDYSIQGIDNTVTAMAKDANGLMYFGLSTGIYVWDGSDLQYYDLLSNADRQKNVFQPRVNSIYVEDVVVWVGTSNGLYKFLSGALSASWVDSLKDASSFSSASVGVISASPRGVGMLVGIGKELFHFSHSKFQQVLTLPSEIRSLYAGPYQIWLATGSTGLYSVFMDDTSQINWDSVSKFSDMPDRYGNQAIIMTDTHNLWVAASENGLFRITGMFGQ